jgi:hypothetical protein
VSNNRVDWSLNENSCVSDAKLDQRPLQAKEHGYLETVLEAMEKQSKLTYLYCGTHNKMSLPAFESVCAITPQLKSLILNGTSARALSHLSTNACSDCNVDEIQVGLLVEALNSCAAATRLEQLQVGFDERARKDDRLNPSLERSLPELARFVSASKALRSLVVRGSAIKLHAVIDSVNDCRSLRDLDIGNVHVDTLAALTAMLARNRTLHSLALRFSDWYIVVCLCVNVGIRCICAGNQARTICRHSSMLYNITPRSLRCVVFGPLPRVFARSQAHLA